MKRRTLALALALACGNPDERSCNADADCGTGTRCEMAGSSGLCVPGNTLALTAPAPGARVGGPGTAAKAVLGLAEAGTAAPASVELLADGAPVATLTRHGSGSPVTYVGTFTPAAGADGPVALRVRAVLVRETLESEPVAVTMDTAAPDVAIVDAECPGRSDCERDGLLAVTASSTAADLAGVTVSLDLEAGRSVPMARSGPGYAARIDLGSFAFPHFSRDVEVRVTARDAAGNTAVATRTIGVTRLRWAYTSAATAVSAPAILGDGTALIGVSATADQLRSVSRDGNELWRLTVGANSITAAPSVGSSAIWVGSEDGRVYAVKLDGSAILNGAGCDTGANVRATPAVSATMPEVAFATSGSGRIFAADAVGTCTLSPLTDVFTAGPVVNRSGDILTVTAGVTFSATLHRYLFDGAFTPGWTTQIGVDVSAALALDSADRVWTGSQDAKLNKTTPSGSTGTVKTLPGSIIDSAVILGNGEIVVGDQSRVVHRFTQDGAQVWSSEPMLGGPVLAALVLAGGSDFLVVPTTAGTLHGIAADGTVRWSGTLSGGQALSEGNIYTPPGARVGTAYFGCADGKLYAVAVDGHLDASAPWPKSHHDVRNTGNAASPLP